MKLLIITQKVEQNDAILGFFAGWLREFAAHVEKVSVITLSQGQFKLPANVEVFSLGKEAGQGRIRRLLKFRKLAKQLLPQVDAVLAHMCPEYIVAVNHLNKSLKKPLYLWYTHKSVSPYLLKAEKLVNKIFSASSESCRLPSDKIVVTGHGIDLEHFQPQVKMVKDYFEILTVGRIAPVKNLHKLIAAFSQLSDEVKNNVRVKIVGEPLLEPDRRYLDQLKMQVVSYKLQNKVDFIGPVAYKDLPAVLSQADLFINLSQTGSIDKAVLEAMAMNIPVLTTNEAFKDLLPAECFCRDQELPERMAEFCKNPPSAEWRSLVVKNHGLTSLIKKIIDEIF